MNDEEYYRSERPKWETFYPYPLETKEVELNWKNHGILLSPQEYYNSILRKIEVPKGEKAVLDFGCGTGVMLNYFTKEFTKLYGVDINRLAIEKGAKRYPRFMLSQNDGVSTQFDSNFFDLVHIGGVLPHIRHVDRPLLFDEMKRISRYLLIQEEHYLKTETVTSPVNTAFKLHKSDYFSELNELFNEIEIIKEGKEWFGLYKLS